MIDGTARVFMAEAFIIPMPADRRAPHMTIATFPSKLPARIRDQKMRERPMPRRESPPSNLTLRSLRKRRTPSKIAAPEKELQAITDANIQAAHALVGRY
jgi:hypothetical protein